MAYRISDERLAALGITEPLPTDKSKRRMVLLKATGLMRSVENRASDSWLPDGIEPTRAIRVSVPFEISASKGYMWRSTRFIGEETTKQAAMRLRASLSEKLAQATGGQRWFHGKTWLDIFVEKTSARIDAVNFVDLVSDAVKDGIALDDRWFSVQRIDWSIVKDSPRLIVGVFQTIDCDYAACSFCGSILPQDTEHFNGASNQNQSNLRLCRGCSSYVKGRYKTIVDTGKPAAKKIPDSAVAEICEKYARGDINQHELAVAYGVQQPQISRIVRGIRRSNVTTKPKVWGTH